MGQPAVKALPVKKVHSVDSEHPVINNKESTNIKLQSIGVEPSPPPKVSLMDGVKYNNPPNNDTRRCAMTNSVDDFSPFQPIDRRPNSKKRKYA